MWRLVAAIVMALEFAKVSAFNKTSSCFEVRLFDSGLGSAMGNAMLLATFLRTRPNYTTFHIDGCELPGATDWMSTLLRR